MERPWLILPRVLTVSPPPVGGHHLHQDAEGPVVVQAAEAGAQAQEEQHAEVGEAAEHAAAANAAIQAQLQAEAQAEEDGQEQADEAIDEAQVQLEASVVNVNTNPEQSQLAHLAMGAGQPDYESDFTIFVKRPPWASSLVAFRRSHPDPARRDVYPYIIAAGRFCLLVHFAIAPSYGTNFDQHPTHSNLVVVRHFLRDYEGFEIDACALRVPNRPLGLGLRSIEGVGLVCNQETGHYQIAELIVTTGAPQAFVVYFRSGNDVWDENDNNNPLLLEDRHRDWVPHGTVTVNSTVLWFDLSWGIISCNLAEPLLEQVLHFHRLPHGRVLLAGAGVPDLHCRRLIAVSENLVRYVEIILHPHQAATVNMWYRNMVGNPDGWIWQSNYSVSFEDIWADESYALTGLPPNPPMLVGVSPVNSNVVYFSLNQRLFGVNVPEHTVVHCEEYGPLKRPGPPDEPVTSRYLITWNLDADAAPNIGHQQDELSDHRDSSASGPADEGEIVNQTPQE